MQLVDLSDRYGAFYAPTFAVRVARQDLVRDELVPIGQVEADLELGAAGRFTFTVVNSWSLKDRAFLSGRRQPLMELLGFGTEVEICMGYGDARTTPVIMSGLVCSITTSFPEGGSPELAISGYDHAFPLTNGKSSRTWSQAADSAAVHEIASFHNLGAAIETTTERHAQIEQNQESDFEFIKKLADRNHFEVYVDAARTLHFGKPRDRASAAVTLRWGEGLLSFKPEANLAGQIAEVKVYGWDTKNKKQIVGSARAGDESDVAARDQSAATRIGSTVRDPSKRPVLRLRQPVFTQAEADKRAKAAFNERAKEFLTGEAEAVGLPEIRPDTRVALENLGNPFSRTYYVHQATHKVDGSGYRTRFKVKDTSL
jgi:phage protein D